MDYRDLLMKYIKYIGQAEGADFILDTTGRHTDPIFAPEEWDELERLAREVHSLPPEPTENGRDYPYSVRR